MNGVKGDRPKTSREVANPRVQHCICQKVGSPRNHLPFQIPAMNSTWGGSTHTWASPRLVPCARDNVKVVCLLLSEEVEFDA